MLDFARFGFTGEPVARDSIAAGADLVLFSGDKLLGGPQAGILAGKKEHIQKIEKDPLMRAFRLDKMTLAALEATLRLYLDLERRCARSPACACSARRRPNCAGVPKRWPIDCARWRRWRRSRWSRMWRTSAAGRCRISRCRRGWWRSPRGT